MRQSLYNERYAIMSIKGKYVSRLFDGSKKFEYRKQIFKEKVDKVFIYESRARKRIVGMFSFREYMQGSPSEIWDKTKSNSGIDEKAYFKYFNNCNIAYAIVVSDLIVFKEPFDPCIFEIDFTPPVSYKYINNGALYEKLCSMVSR